VTESARRMLTLIEDGPRWKHHAGAALSVDGSRAVGQPALARRFLAATSLRLRRTEGFS
jgi:hypothetical protein